uniref:Ribonuclease H-like domain-containing protein n=1 Tax=Tanacetum cinerariifolium TaxID=118510 RepID=A0A6L2MR54_TANCI|nr:ribonuclease H-like domain-containing protein [Tanacetum cinerariifolium]
MIAILKKSKHNVDFHQIVDFVEASHIRYALTINPTVYVSHIRQFWSTARIKTTNEGTKILATIDGKPRTISESSIRRNLKLNDEEGISTLPDAKLFENLALMGYNILPNQTFTFQKGQFSHQWKFLIHTIMQCLSPKSVGFNEFSSNIATAVVKAQELQLSPHHTPSPKAQQSSHHELSSSLHPTTTTETIPTTIPTESPTLRQYSRRATRIAQSKALPTAADEPASPLGDDSQGEAFPTITGLDAGQDRENIIKTSALPHDSTPRVTPLMLMRARIKLLEAKHKGTVELSGDDALIKGISLETGEEAAISVPPVAEIPTVGVPTGSGLVPTVSAIFTTASVVTPYSRRKEMARDAQRMNEHIARDAKIARIHAKEELQMLINGLDRNNEVIAKHLQEYKQVAAELTIGEKIELINELVKYRDHHAKILKGMTLKEIREKFIPIWKQIEDFVPMALKEKGERVKRKGLWLEQGSAKKMKTSEEVSEEDLKEMMQLVPVEEVYVKASQVKHLIIDWEIYREGKRVYWKVIRIYCYYFLHLNRSLIHTHHNKTPYELVHGKKPDLKILRVFGALYYPTNHSEDLVVLACTPSSTTINQDAPSTSDSPSSLEVQALILHQGVAAGPNFKDNPFAHANNDPFVNVFTPEPNSKESSSWDVSTTKSNHVIQPHKHLRK